MAGGTHQRTAMISASPSNQFAVVLGWHDRTKHKVKIVLNWLTGTGNIIALFLRYYRQLPMRVLPLTFRAGATSISAAIHSILVILAPLVPWHRCSPLPLSAMAALLLSGGVEHE